MKREKEGEEQIREAGIGNLLPFIHPMTFAIDIHFSSPI